jgi:glycosyltransferase involved in cell wall biosynthesis
VITPAYNASEFLPQTIASALSQTYRDFELLVVDDGSTDNTLEIAQRFTSTDSRIRVLRRSHAGPSAARNSAIAQARGEYLALLDSDDLWQPTFLEAQVSLLRARPRVDVVTGNAYNLGGPLHGQPMNPTHGCREIAPLEILQRENSIFIMSVFRRVVVERTGGFDESLPLNEDYDFWIRAAHAGCVFLYNPVPLGHYRRRPDSMSSNHLQMVTGIMHVLRKAQRLFAGRPRELAAIERQLARFEEERLLAKAKTNLVERNFSAATDDFNSLFSVKRDFMSGVIARMSRYFPGLLLWAYRAKRALRLGGAPRQDARTPNLARSSGNSWHSEVRHVDRA